MEVTLYVVFHGSWSFLQFETNIFVKTPDIGDEHVYRAGNWLAENTIRRGSLHWLENVTGDKSTVVSRTLNPVIADAKLAATTHRGSYTTWIFPRPKAIHSLGQLKIAAGALEAAKGQVYDQATNQPTDPKNKQFIASLIQVFEYTYDDAALLPPAIEGIRWDPIAIPDGGRHFATLHLFAEHETKEPKGEPSNHFAEAYRYGSLILAADLRLRVNPGDVCKYSSQVPAPAGLDTRCFELEPLRARTDRLRKAGESRATLSAAYPRGLDMRDAWPNSGDGCLDKIMMAFECPPTGPDGDTPTCLPGWGEGSCP